MSEWRDISTAPRDGVFVLLHNDRWSSDVEGFWHKGSQSWSANTRIPPDFGKGSLSGLRKKLGLPSTDGVRPLGKKPA
jgi:hypothetical protein